MPDAVAPAGAFAIAVPLCPRPYAIDRLLTMARRGDRKTLLTQVFTITGVAGRGDADIEGSSDRFFIALLFRNLQRAHTRLCRRDGAEPPSVLAIANRLIAFARVLHDISRSPLRLVSRVSPCPRRLNERGSSQGPTNSASARRTQRRTRTCALC